LSQALREPASGTVNGAGDVDLEFGAPSLNQVWTGSIVVQTDDAAIAWQVLIGGTPWGSFQGGGPYGPLQARANERVQLIGTGATPAENIAGTFIGSLDPDDGSTPYVGPSSAVTTASSVTPVLITGQPVEVVPVSGGDVFVFSAAFSSTSTLVLTGGALDIHSALLVRTSGTGVASVVISGAVLIANGENTDAVALPFPRAYPVNPATDIDASVSGAGTWIFTMTYTAPNT
jgi:hypothetical protein